MRDAIVIKGVSKQFRRYHPDRPRTLKDALVRGFRWVVTPVEQFWALREVSFSVASGRMIGIVGGNGAGKSTLLRLIGGVMRPDEGTVQVHGRIGALLDLGTGFHQDLSGRENVFVSGVIAGLTRDEVAQRFDAIVAFAELQEFIDSPLRTYSTGMQMRLAFAVAVHTEPEILLIDEVLAVGDLAFQQKCLERITQFKNAGCTIVLISHDAEQIQKLCEEVLWLREGRLVTRGEPEVVIGQYVAEMATETRRRTPGKQPTLRTSTGAKLRIRENRFGSLELEIISVRLLNPEGFPVIELESDTGLYVEIRYLAPQTINAPVFGVTISREDGVICYETSTTATGLVLPTLQGQGQVSLHLERLNLNGGRYYVDVGVYEKDWSYAYDYHWHVYPLHIRPTKETKGMLSVPHHWEFQNEPIAVALPQKQSFSRHSRSFTGRTKKGRAGNSSRPPQ